MIVDGCGGGGGVFEARARRRGTKEMNERDVCGLSGEGGGDIYDGGRKGEY